MLLTEAQAINTTMARITSRFARHLMVGLLLGLLASTTQGAGTLQPFEADSLADFKGTTHTLDDFRGKVMAVNF